MCALHVLIITNDYNDVANRYMAKDI